MTIKTHQIRGAGSAIFQLRSLKVKIILLTLGIFLFGIWALAFYASKLLHQKMEELVSEQQFSTVTFMADEINAEFGMRVDALKTITETVTPELLRNPAAMQTLLESQPILYSLFNNGVAVAGIDGTVIADFPHLPKRIGTNFSERDYISGPLKEGKVTIGRPVMSKLMHAPAFVIGVPIRDKERNVIGVIGGVVDLHLPNFLDKVTGNRYGKTGGYLLLAPQHQLIITGTDKNWIMQPFPALGINPLIDRFVKGYEGSGVTVDSRGLEVLSSAKQIPVSGWMIVARIPTKEAFALIHEMIWYILTATVFLTLLAGGLIWWLLKHQLLPIFTTIKAIADLSNADQPMQPLPITRRDEIGDLIDGFNGLLLMLNKREQALKESETNYKQLFDNSPVGIYRVDFRTGKFLKANDVICKYSGFSPEEITSHSPYDFLTDDSKQLLSERLGKMELGEEVMPDPEYEIIDKNGIYRWLQLNSKNIYDEKGLVIGADVVAHDITERKLAEKILQDTLESLRRSFGTIIQVMVSAVESRDPYTAGHQLRVADLARTIATEMGLDQEKIEGIRMAGSIHDIGKLSIPSEILTKPTKLTNLEFSLIKEHSQKGFEMLKNVESSWPLAEIVYQHHERMDGSGYPRQLKGEEIIIEARIMAVADVVEAMASHRPYRPSLGLNSALAEIENNKGTHYDADVVDACLRLFREKGFQLEGTPL